LGTLFCFSHEQAFSGMVPGTQHIFPTWTLHLSPHKGYRRTTAPMWFTWFLLQLHCQRSLSIRTPRDESPL